MPAAENPDTTISITFFFIDKPEINAINRATIDKANPANKIEKGRAINELGKMK